MEYKLILNTQELIMLKYELGLLMQDSDALEFTPEFIELVKKIESLDALKLVK